MVQFSEPITQFMNQMYLTFPLSLSHTSRLSEVNPSAIQLVASIFDGEFLLRPASTLPWALMTR